MSGMFSMMVGLPASGKSTFAKNQLCGGDSVYLSSDELRKEILGDMENQENNNLIFLEMKKRAVEALNQGKHVVYDATNIGRKKRMAFINSLPKDCRKDAFYMATPFHTAVKQNNERERTVPVDYITMLYKTLHIPTVDEGWDNVYIIHHEDVEHMSLPKLRSKDIKNSVTYNNEEEDLAWKLGFFFPEVGVCNGLEQDNPHHTLTVSEHLNEVYDYVHKNYHGKKRDVLLWASILHDIGKAETKSFYNHKGEKKNYASFIGHENVGAQKAVIVLRMLNFKDDFIMDVAKAIQFHMEILKGIKKEKLVRKVGEEFYEILEALYEADTNSK